MFQALARLALLPAATKVCCAHEYTENNLRWAAERCPQNADIQQRYQAVKSLRVQGDSACQHDRPGAADQSVHAGCDG